MTLAGQSVRLCRFLADCGVCSRRAAIEYIKQGLVTVNGVQTREPWRLVTVADRVTYQKYTIKPVAKIYVMLNKPRGIVTSVKDDQGRATVTDLIKIRQRLFPVGRLDRDTTGLLILTNDGDIAQKLAHPRYQISKTYKATLSKPLSPLDAETIKKGFRLFDGFIKPDRIRIVPGTRGYQVLVHLHSGKNHIIKRMFYHLEYEVEQLERIAYGPLLLRGLARGAWRMLTQTEVKTLMLTTASKVRAPKPHNRVGTSSVTRNKRSASTRKRSPFRRANSLSK